MSRKTIWALCTLMVGALALPAVAGPDLHRFDPLLKKSWYGLYMQGAKIGYMSIALERISEPVDGWQLATHMALGIKVGNDSSSLTTDDTRFYRAPESELIRSHMNVTSPTGNIEVSGQVRGTEFVLTTNVGGKIDGKSLKYPFDFLDSIFCVETHILSGGLKIGDSLFFAYFEPTPPLTGLIHQAVKITGEEKYLFNGVPTDVIIADVTLQEAGITMKSRYDRSGNLIEGMIGGALIAKLEDEAEAQRIDHAFDMLQDNVIRVGRELPEPSEIRKLTLRIRGVDASSLISTNTQTVMPVSAGEFMLELAMQKSVSGAPDLPIDTVEMVKYLASDPYVQADDPKIIAQARQIAGGEENSWVAARLINRWVYENIEKKFTPDFSNALQTLKSRRGDCGEHAALTVALLRAGGIPAREIVGLVYWPAGQGFGYHAWVEAFVGEWVQMDPTWGEYLANPARIAIARGDIIAQVGALYKIMGRINIEVVVVE